ncbi:MAG TPA: hydroxymyristoyl-ACP dehydratase [Clostridium sp.]|nr:hydroxymyristoyl-ACP dehydratase [uncultured Clostridium sp.]NLU08834.1 hydroxymyristoyl-ACP dehydratase [Clostridiales bacterium]HBC97371.1 hydroxymyristoyl-ACP dehydratase [Clostridium sp.]
MMNINCSEKCIHEKNGKCTLNHITSIEDIPSQKTNCMYFSPKESGKK